MQVNPRGGGADLVWKAPHAVLCQLQHLARAAARSDAIPNQSASAAAGRDAVLLKIGDDDSHDGLARSQDVQSTQPGQCASTHCTITVQPPSPKRLRAVVNDHEESGKRTIDRALQAGPRAAVQMSASSHQAVDVTTTSDYGVHRRRTFAAAQDVAVALVDAAEAAPASLRAPFCDIRVGPKASVLLLTWRKWEAQRAAGDPSMIRQSVSSVSS